MTKEYIEREAALEKVIEVKHHDPELSGVVLHRYIKEIDLKDIPAADVAPVVHGRWEYTPQTFNTLGQIRCPFCAWWSLDQSIDGIYKYCPNCGAYMMGENNGKCE
jgi:hypothetical protein|nr:MAG TPA: DNA-directed RNA polymerase [Caudoviricetes sp.]